MTRWRAASAILFLAGVLTLAPAADAQTTDPVRAALEARILQLEEDLRRLTGRVEELEHQQSGLVDRLERLVGAVDERLSAVEPAPSPAGPPMAAAEPPAPAAPPEPSLPGESTFPRRPAPSAPPPSQAAGPAPDIAPDASAARGYVLGTISRDAARNAPTLPTGDVGYEGALNLLQAGRWEDAGESFRLFLDRNPDDPRAASAAYWLAETYFFRKDYPNAAAAFARNYRAYGPEDAKAPDNLLKLGMSLSALGDREKACQAFGELARRHANAPAPVRQTLSRERTAAGCA